jgi:hypothetical protein
MATREHMSGGDKHEMVVSRMVLVESVKSRRMKERQKL